MTMTINVLLIFSLLPLAITDASSSFVLAPPFRDERGSIAVVFQDEARMGENEGFLELHRQAFIVSGRVYYADPVNLKAGQETYSFHTSFTFQILEYQFPEMRSSGGMAFLITPKPDPPPMLSYGMYLGLENSSSSSTFFAVEFDTFMDDGVRDPKGRHLGIDLNTAKSVKVAMLPNSTFARNSTWTAWIDYDSPSQTLEVRLAQASSSKPVEASLSHIVDLKNFLPDEGFVGFSASTGRFGDELHRIFSWNFSSQGKVEVAPPSFMPGDSIRSRKTKSCSLGCVVGSTTVGILILGLIVGSAFVIRSRKSRRRSLQTMYTDDRALTCYSFSTLRSATEEFSNDKLIGTGGFGKVFKGVLDGCTVAVKVLSEFSSQGEDQFRAEISLISQLRHKNLVSLKGWCQHKDKLLLVYEYMPNGALDTYIFSKPGNVPRPALSWRLKHGIIKGTAEALAYLHASLKKPILHRDIKAGNVLLDENFTACLGDFGLARLIEQENVSAQSMTIAGTMGYIAPELAYNGRANEKSDVYSFGILLLEIVWEQRAVERNVLLLDFVWEAHEKGELMKRIASKYTSDAPESWEEVKTVVWVALDCCNPDPESRPRMRRCCQIFEGDASPVPPSLKRPRLFSQTSVEIGDVSSSSKLLADLTN